MADSREQTFDTTKRRRRCPVCGCPLRDDEYDHYKWCPGDVGYD